MPERKRGKKIQRTMNILEALSKKPNLRAEEVMSLVDTQCEERGCDSVSKVKKILDLFVEEGVINGHGETTKYSPDDMAGRDIVVYRYYPDSDSYQEFYIQVKSSEKGISSFRNQIQYYLNRTQTKRKRNLSVDKYLLENKIIVVNGQDSNENINQALIDGILAIENYHRYLYL